MAKPAVFVDRDGVLIRETNYLRRLDRLRLIKGSAEAVRRLRAAGFKVVAVTNQSGVGRGYFPRSFLREAHALLGALLARKGAKLDGIYVCPHAPRDACRCRKPKPYLLRKAARELGLDISRSYFVGDTTTDVATARAAGCLPLVVRTGKGGRDGKYAAVPAAAARNLLGAARWILRAEARRARAGGSSGARRSKPRSGGR